jgi:centrosomal protein CEP41
MSVKKPIGDPNILQKKLVQNAKYEGVGSTVDTGITVNVTKALKDNEVSIKQQQGELFRRMRPSSLANLLAKKIQQAQMEEQLQNLSLEDQQHLRMAMGQNDMPDFPLPPRVPPKDVLLLDLRERDQFEKCHIGSAISYEASYLSRAMNQFTREILSYKNKPNSIIVLYDLEEEIVVARKAANVFVERGFENIVILSGGLKEFVQEHSALIVGESPVPIIPKPQAVIQGRRLLSSRSSNANGDSSSTLGTSLATSHKPKSLSSSLARRKAAEGSAWH